MARWRSKQNIPATIAKGRGIVWWKRSPNASRQRSAGSIVRLLALIPGLAVSAPVKKWAGAAALAAAAFHLLLSGAEVATQRSFFMTAAVLIAVLADRRATVFRRRNLEGAP
jgi:hypothetical protein